MKRLALSLSLSLSAAPALAESGPRYRDLRSQAEGRTGVASSSGVTALFLNPAGLAGGEGGGAGLSLDVGVNAVLVDYAGWAARNSAHLGNSDSLLSRLGPIEAKWAPFSQAMSLEGRVGDVAFAVVSDSRYDLMVTKAVVTPVLGIGVLSDQVITAGRGFEGPEGYRFGFALKYLYRIRYDRRLVGTTDEAFYVINDNLRSPDNGLWDRLDKIKTAAEVARTSHGAGLNLGAEKDFGDRFTGGLSLLDVPTVLGSGLVRPDINLGLAFRSGTDLAPGLDDRVTVNLDYQRFLIPGTPWFRQIKLGASFEASRGRRQVGYLSLGLNDGYPTFGFRFGYLAYLSYVYTAEELGTYPGQEKLSFHKLSVQLEL